MKNTIRGTNFRRIRCLMVLLVFCLLFAGCTRNGMKTIVLEEPEKAGAGSPGSGSTIHLENSKVYKYSSFNILDNEPVTEEMMGWFDADNTATLLTRMHDGNWESSLESVHYKFHFSREILKITSDIVSYKISPDGSRIAYVKNDQTLAVMDTGTRREQTLLEPDNEVKDKVGTLSWSNNGRFLCYAAFSKSSGQSTLFTYDFKNGSAYPIQLESTPSQLLPKSVINYGLYRATVSDDGSKLLLSTNVLGSIYNDDYLIGIYELDPKTFTIKRNIQVGEKLMSACSFLDSSTIIFINARTKALNLFDMATSGITELTGDVGFYRASADGKNLIYGKNSLEGASEAAPEGATRKPAESAVKGSGKSGRNLYAAKIRERKLEEEKLVFEDFYPENVSWSPDNRKIQLSGRYIYMQERAAAAAGESYNSLQNIIIELN